MDFSSFALTICLIRIHFQYPNVVPMHLLNGDQQLQPQPGNNANSSVPNSNEQVQQQQIPTLQTTNVQPTTQ